MWCFFLERDHGSRPPPLRATPRDMDWSMQRSVLGAETGSELAFVSSFPKHLADTRKRPDFERWRVAECVEIKNYFDNCTFLICNEDELSPGTTVMMCVFSYKREVKTDCEGKETVCKTRMDADGRFHCVSTVRNREMGTGPMGTILIRASWVPRNSLRINCDDLAACTWCIRSTDDFQETQGISMNQWFIKADGMSWLNDGRSTY